jgi:hypothetical protein
MGDLGGGSEGRDDLDRDLDMKFDEGADLASQ